MSMIDVYSHDHRSICRQTGRSLARINSRAATEIAQVQSQADIQGAKVDAIGTVSQRAMQSIAFVSQVEQQLGQVVPLAVSRLQAIGDLAALGMGQTLADTVTRLGRL